jgi:group I intron endonuclease
MIISGIYKITNTINNKVYIGKATKLSARIGSHKYLLRKNKHNNNYLLNAWNKYGEESFTFTIIEKCERFLLPEKEAYWVSFYNSNDQNFGYNLMVVGRKNHHHSDETKKKMSDAKLGKKNTAEHNRNCTLTKYKTVLQFDKQGNFIKEWLGASYVRDVLGYPQSNITAVCNGLRKTARGFIWKYKN